MIEVIAIRGGLVPYSQTYCLLEHPNLRKAVAAEDGSHHLLFGKSCPTIQILVRSADIAEPVHFLVNAVVASSDVKSHLRSVERFSGLITGMSVPSNSLLRGSKWQRLGLILRVLDGRLAGASYREIAIGLFGRNRVERDWDQSDNHLKNRIRRAAQRGKFLMEGGYRDFLM